jgi:hypothetical protein
MTGGMAATKSILGQPSWVVKSADVELAVTVRGGHMAPVTFFRGSSRPVRPYYISPWQGSGTRTGEPVLDVLRGDFFCMPFGAANKLRREDHPAHGEPAGSTWRFVGLTKARGVTELALAMTTKARRGTVSKKLSLVDGENVTYIEHDLSAYSGPLCFSHHAILDVPPEPSSMRVSVSPFRLGRVAPRRILTNDVNEYYALAPGRRFSSLDRVPTIWRDLPWADCSSQPHLRGFMDVIAVYPRSGALPAWTAVTVPSRGYLWFSLRDPSLLPQTVLWMDNGGRHASPWGGTNRCLGVEDGCAYFASGLAESARKNDLNTLGIPTALRFRPDRAVRVAHIQGVARIPAGFDRVRTASFRQDAVLFTSWSGKTASARVRWRFLEEGSASLRSES